MAEGDITVQFDVKVELDPRWRQLTQKVVQAVQIAARNVETRAKEIVPVDTGNLMNSITAKSESESEWRVSTNVDYADDVEFGTSRMKGRPYLVPALEQERPRLEKAVVEIAKELK